MPASYQSGEDSLYCYPGSQVLKNKLNIKDLSMLSEAEREITTASSSILRKEHQKGALDFKHLKSIHYALFHDLYSWAGKVRQVNIAKGELFCLPEHIDGMAEDIFCKLQKENYLVGTPKEQIAEKLAYYTGEVNALHPFREGNGRTQREFFRCVGAVAGYEINFKGITQEEMIQASKEAFACHYQSMTKLYQKAIQRPLNMEEHRKLAEQILVKNSPPEKILQAYQDETAWKQELSRAGFRPTKKLLQDRKQLQKMYGRNLTVKEIKERYQARERLPKKEKELLSQVGEDFKQQEAKQRKMPIPEAGPEI